MDAGNRNVSELNAKNITVTISGKNVVHDASFSFGSGELVTLLGSNGAGKSTLIKSCLGTLRMSTGTAIIDGVHSHKLSAIQRAKKIAYLPQARPLAWPNSVRDVVSLGRYSFGAAPGKLNSIDAAAIDKAIAGCGLTDLSDRRTDTLSGGELARVHCARAMASQAPLLIADEPTASLDPKHQLTVMELFKTYVASGGGALVVLHDVALAARYASRMLWMKDGALVADGTPEDTLTEQRLADVYGVEATVTNLSVEMHRAL